MDAAIYWLRTRGRINGPFTHAQLRELRDRGALTRFHEISVDQQNWRPAAALDEVLLSGGAQGGRAAAPPLDAALWFYTAAGGQQQGPMSWLDLMEMQRHRQLTEDTPVWREGMPLWLPLREVRALSGSALEQGESGATGPTLGRIATNLLIAGGILTMVPLLLILCASLIQGEVRVTGSSQSNTAAATAVLLGVVCNLVALLLDTIASAMLGLMQSGRQFRQAGTVALSFSAAELLFFLVALFLSVAADSLSGGAVFFLVLLLLTFLARPFALQGLVRAVVLRLRAEGEPYYLRWLRFACCVLAGLSLLYALLTWMLPSPGTSLRAGLLFLFVLLGLGHLVWRACYVLVLFQLRRWWTG